MKKVLELLLYSDRKTINKELLIEYSKFRDKYNTDSEEFNELRNILSKHSRYKYLEEIYIMYRKFIKNYEFSTLLSSLYIKINTPFYDRKKHVTNLYINHFSGKCPGYKFISEGWNNIYFTIRYSINYPYLSYKDIYYNLRNSDLLKIIKKIQIWLDLIVYKTNDKTYHDYKLELIDYSNVCPILGIELLH